MPRVPTIRLGRARRALVSTILLTILIPTAALDAQVFKWSTMGGGSAWKQGNGIAVDGAGNTFAVGKFSPQPSNDPQTSTLISFGNEPPLTVAGVSDAFVVMHTAGGTLRDVLQLKSQGPGDAVTATGVAYYNTGGPDKGLYITGEISGSADFGGAGLVTGPAESGSSYIAKISVAGSGSDPLAVEWVALLSPAPGTKSAIHTSAIAVYDERIYVTGDLHGGIVAHSAPMFSITTPAMSSPEISSMFIARYHIEGTPEEIAVVEPVGATSTSRGLAIVAGTVTDGLGTNHTRVGATGIFRGHVRLHGQNLTGEVGDDNLLLAIVDDIGAITALRGASKLTGSNTGRIGGRGIAMSAEGDFYVTGDVGGTVAFSGVTNTLASAGARDYFIAKFAGLSGTLQFALRGGATATSEAFANAIAINDAVPRQIFVTGAVAGTIAAGNISVTSMGNHDIFVAKYLEPTSGIVNIDWARRAGNRWAAENRNHLDQGKGIAVTRSGDSYIVGEFGGDGDPLGDAEFFQKQNLSADHFRNVFIAGLTPTAALLRGRVILQLGSAQIPHKGHRVVVALPSSPGTTKDEVMTGADGWFTAYAPLGQSFVVQADGLPQWTLQAPLSGAYSGNVTSSTLHFTFGPSSLRPTPDLRITATPIGTQYATPGGQRCYRVYYENHGTGTLSSDALIQLIPNGLLTSPVTVSTTGPQLDPTQPDFTWRVQNLIAPLDNGEIIVCFDFPQHPFPTPPIKSGDPLPSYFEIRSQGEDPQLRDDNSARIDDEVFFPLDPNVKRSIPDGNLDVVDVRKGHAIEYVIDFYNLGPGIAEHVTIQDDFLDEFFEVGNTSPDFFTVIEGRPGDVSGVATAPRQSPPNTTHRTTRLDLANLLAMPVDVDLSRGSLRFTALLKTGIEVGKVVRNAAHIQFDTQVWFTTNVMENCVAPGFDVSGFCVGGPTQFTSIPSTTPGYLPTGATDVRWSFGDATTSNDDNPTHQFAGPGTYIVTMRFTYADDICGTTRIADTHAVTKTITIYAIPAQPGITRIGDTLIADSAASYQWLDNGDSIDGATGRELDVTGLAGPFVVITSNEGGCSSSSEPFVSVETEDEELGEVTVAPNPGAGRFEIELSRPAPHTIAVSVHDAGGRLVRTVSIELGARAASIELSAASTGVYTASFSIDGRRVTRRFVVQR